MNIYIFCDITPYSLFRSKRRFRGTCRLHLQAALKIHTVCSSEMSADFQRTTRRYIPEDRILQVPIDCEHCIAVFNATANSSVSK
jgi:hypothetical protein